MARTRISTTVDSDLLADARALTASTDSSMVERALAALIAAHRRAEIDESYAAYDDQPIEQPDEWGDLASFREAIGRS